MAFSFGVENWGYGGARQKEREMPLLAENSRRRRVEKNSGPVWHKRAVFVNPPSARKDFLPHFTAWENIGYFWGMRFLRVTSGRFFSMLSVVRHHRFILRAQKQNTTTTNPDFSTTVSLKQNQGEKNE